MTKRPKIGFIGLGTMGQPTAIHLIEAGYDLIVNDLRDDPVAELVGHGAVAAETPAQLARDADIFVTLLPEGAHLKAVALGDDGLIEGAGEGDALIDMSTVGASAFLEVAESLDEKGVTSIDAPVSGGEEGAIQAELSIMAGGDPDAIDRYRPILETVGSVTRIGGRGAGQVAKIANAIITGANLVAIAETFTFVEQLDVDTKRVYEAIKDGAAQSWEMDNRAPWMLAGTFDPGFPGSYHYKDMRIAIEDAQDANAPVPVASAVHEMFKVQEQLGYGELDESAVYKVYQTMAGRTTD